MDVRLSVAEVRVAAQIGAERYIEALRKRLPDKHGADENNGWSLHIEGAAGEMAAAKALGMYWSAPVGTFKSGGDVGSVQVRTRSRHDYDLIVRDGDRDDDAFVLVTGRTPDFAVRGWIIGSHAKQPCYRKRYGGREEAYFVGAADLLDLDKLKAEVQRRAWW